MTTLRQIIIDGFRESGIIAVGATPEADENSEALERLQNIITTLFGNELGESLISLDYGTNNVHTSDVDSTSEVDSIFVPSNVRLICNDTSPKTIYLNPLPRDGARFGVIDLTGNFNTNPITIYGNGRNIEATGSIVLNTALVNKEWFYREDLGSWVHITDLLEGDQSPFPPEFDDFLITLLAIRLNPRYGAETGQDTVGVLQNMKRQFKSRYRQNQEMHSELGILRLPSTHKWFYTFSSSDYFKRGIIPWN